MFYNVIMARTLPIETFRDYAAPEVFQRGKRYYQQDAVNKFSRQGNTLFARVYGSYNYRVNITLLERNDKPDEYGLKSARCSCPYSDTFDGLCKHTIAVLLKFHHEGAAETVTAAKYQGTDARAKLAELSKEDLKGLLEHLFNHYPDAADVAAVFWQQQTITQQASSAPTDTPTGEATTTTSHAPAEAEIDTRPYCALMERAASQPDLGQGPICYPQAHELLEKVTPLLEASAYVDAFKLTWDLLETFIDTASNLDEDIIHEILYMDVYGDEYYDVEEDDSIAFGDSELLEQFDRLLAQASLGAQASISDDTRKATIEKITAWEDSLDGEYAEVAFPLATYALGSTFHVSNEETKMYEEYAKSHLKHAHDDFHTVALSVMKNTHGQDAALEYAKQHERGVKYLALLLERNDIDTVMGCYQDYVHSLADILTLIRQLEPRYPQHAATIAHYGIDYADTLQQQEDTPERFSFLGGVAIHTFLEDIGQLAARLEARPLHSRAARLLFQVRPTLPTFKTLGQITDDSDWPTLREELLGELIQKRSYPPSDMLDILLSEQLVDAAVNFIQDRHPASVSIDNMWRVMDAAAETHSSWVIKRGSKHAEQLVTETKSSRYPAAITSLTYVKRAYLASDQGEQWQAYAEKLATEHKRKRNFMTLFEPLL